MKKLKKKLFILITPLLQTIFMFIPKFVLNYIWGIFDSYESNLALLFRNLYVQKYAKKYNGFIFIGKYVTIKNIQYISFGENISIHAYCYIEGYGEVFIGNNVSIANHSIIISSNHTWNDLDLPIKYNPVTKETIIIKDDVWIASNVKILGGVVISKRNVIAAGAVVTKDTIENSIYAGVPAKLIKNINME